MAIKNLSFESQNLKKTEEYQKVCESLITHVAPRDDSHWKIARKKLIEHYGLNAQLIDRLHEKGSIYANALNIIFPHRFCGSGRVIGATLQPVEDESNWKTIGDNSSAWFVVGDLESGASVVAVDSPINALRYYTHFSGWAVVSCLDSTVPIELMLKLAVWYQNLVIAFPNTDAGIRGITKARKDAKKIGLPVTEENYD